uniref:Uncharacterized protein n=1 Tax=Mycena chlorophos TaxID=658473 RepID=A0ABQ0LLY4_MYCCL|nr:predicted protein [Mycena chlorophos]
MNNTPVSAIVLRIAAQGTSKEEFARRAENLANAQLALPASKGALSKIVLVSARSSVQVQALIEMLLQYIPNDTIRDVVKRLQFGLPPVCLLSLYEFASDEARLKLLGNPEFMLLSAEFDPQGTNTAFPVEITTYLDQPMASLSSGPTTTGVTIMNIPTMTGQLCGSRATSGEHAPKVEALDRRISIWRFPKFSAGLRNIQWYVHPSIVSSIAYLNWVVSAANEPETSAAFSGND